ncbi:hypothetical protein EP7_005654 (plasmid) [Isosphaeraceae bacterium EP7]
MTVKQLDRIARDLVAYRDVRMRGDVTMSAAAKKAGCHRRTLQRRMALIPPEFLADIDRSIRLVREAARNPGRSRD